MCGLVGALTGNLPPETAIRRMNDALCHRGPDDADHWIDAGAGIVLAHRRLAVIELSSAGRQPMHSDGGRFVLAFNGEIYNHDVLRCRLERDGQAPQWRGHSDTETLLAGCAAWGIIETLQRSVGMFALALWDRVDRRLFLARDRLGEKPLYYGWTRSAFVFGSELAALRRYPGFDNPIDRDVLAMYCAFGYVPTPYSIFRDVYKLEAGTILSLSLSDAAASPSGPLFAPARHHGLSVERYWSVEEAARHGLTDPITDESEAIHRLEETLTASVQQQSIADVPLGAFLSGGVDSSTIVALMQANSSRKVKTFTIGFEETAFDEAVHARAIANHLGTDHTELRLSPQHALDVVPALSRLYSEPFADSSQIPTHLVSRLARRHVTVALSGDGGDELFAGYNRHLWGPPIWRRLRRIPAPLRHGLGAAIQSVPMGTWDAVGTMLPRRRALSQVGDKAHKLGARLRHVHSITDLYRSLVNEWTPDSGLVPGARHLSTLLDRVVADQALDPARQMMLWDTLTYLPDDILHKVDRAAMGVSLETRVPFLDHRVVELAWRLPLRMKIRDGQGKWIVRQLLYKHVPRELIERPKMGFGIPIDTWLRGPLRDWAEHLLDKSRIRAEGFFDPAPIRQAWAEHLSGARNWQHKLWTVLMFEAWLDSETLFPGPTGSGGC